METQGGTNENYSSIKVENPLKEAMDNIEYRGVDRTEVVLIWIVLTTCCVVAKLVGDLIQKERKKKITVQTHSVEDPRVHFEPRNNNAQRTNRGPRGQNCHRPNVNFASPVNLNRETETGRRTGRRKGTKTVVKVRKN